MLVSIDVGYGFVKAVSEDGRRAWFPSVVTPVPAFGKLAGAIGSQNPGHQVTYKSADGKEIRYLVGDAALLANGVRSWDISTSSRRDYARLVSAALGLLGVARNEATEVDVALGLPMFAYALPEERRALEQQLAGTRAWVQVDDGPGGHVNIRSVYVYAQAVGAYVTAAGDASAPTTQGPVGLIDVGYRTTDYLMLNLTPHGPVPDEARSGSMDAGIGTALENVARHVSDTTGVLVPSTMVEAALAATGALMVRGQRLELKEKLTEEQDLLGGRIVDQVRRAWGDRLDFVDALFVAGGGGKALFGQIKGLHPSTRLLDDPIFANARGFLTLTQSNNAA